MASRYWVGGTASWDGTAGTKWATTSGGAGGASVPTTADDVFFDANSTGTCTIAAGNTGAKTLDCSGFSGTITGTAAITIAGTIYISPTQTYSHTGTITVTGTGTIITSGKTFSGLTINGSGITVTIGSAISMSTRTLSVQTGTLDTAGYSITAGTFNSNSTNVRTVSLGSSTITLSSSLFPVNLAGANLTFNAGTSTINVSSATATITGGNNTFYNVSYTGTALGTRTLNGTNTFNNLSLSVGTNGRTILDIVADQTINGTFSCNGVSVRARAYVKSFTFGTPVTITAGAITGNFCDFRDINLEGAAVGTTVAGDCGGNTGFTFQTPKNVYRVSTSPTWNSTTAWSLTSGGTASSAVFPNPQDTVVIDNNTTGSSVEVNSTTYNISSIDCSGRTSGYSLNFTTASDIYGSITLGTGVTVTGVTIQSFLGRSTQGITSIGKTITFPIVVDKIDSTFTAYDALSTTNTITHNSGIFDASSYNITCTRFISSGSVLRTISMGSGLWTLTSIGTVWDIIATNLTLNKDTANILLNNTTTSARLFKGAGFSYNKLTIGGATGISPLSIEGTGTSFTELDSIKTVAHTLRLTTDIGTIGTWSIKGTAGNLVTFNSQIAGSSRTFNLTNVTSGIDYLSVKDISVNQTNKFYVGTNSTDGGNNLNVIFTDPPVVTVTYGGNFFAFF